MRRAFKKNRGDYSQLKVKLHLRIIGIAVLSYVIVLLFYTFTWRRRGGEWLVSLIRWFFKFDYDAALNIYWKVFRIYIDVIWIVAIVAVFIILLRVILNSVTGYLDAVNHGIDGLLSEETEIHLPSELAETERKLQAVKSALKQRTLEAQLAEQRKNDLVMYLAHDIRTPLTSVIGYLNLLAEVPDMPTEQRAKYSGITLDKAYRLEKMINAFFEIARYNLQEIHISKARVDLYYMLVQLADELSPMLCANGNSVRIQADENITVEADPEQLARVLNNILRNAAAYSFPNTEILISAAETRDAVRITFTNEGKTIPKEKLSMLFEKFYRLDEARASSTGGTGLGLAIAKEIVTLHGGTLSAASEDNRIEFSIELPREVQETSAEN